MDRAHAIWRPVRADPRQGAAQVEALRDPDAARTSALFDPTECAALALEMTRTVAVSDATFAAVRRALGDRSTVELVGTVAAYTIVSRFLVALEVEPED